MKSQIRVLIVEDSPVVQKLLAYILESDPAIRIVGTANNGKEGIRMAGELKPDVVTMDIKMPLMDGFEATRGIMETAPAPIVIVSASWDPKEVAKTFRAMEAGAVAALEKPVGIDNPNYEQRSRELVQTVRLMSEVKVVKRWPKQKLEKTDSLPGVAEGGIPASEVALIAIGASTGGPPVIHKILSMLPEQFTTPILVVQHMAPGFISGFATWLNDTTTLNVRSAVHNEPINASTVYIAPDGFHMGVGPGRRIALSSENPENGLRPSVSYLFRSVSKNYANSAIGVLLTGMGKDGSRELGLMRDRGATTIAQDKESSVVFGMPGEAVAIGAATHILNPEKIAILLGRLANSKGGSTG